MKPRYTFQQFNDEINDFYKYLKDNKYTDKEIRKIFAPLCPTSKRNKFAQAAILTTVAIIAILYFASYIETISWHLSAIGRIFLIKLLPFWDWTHLKNEKCLIYKPFSTPTLTEEISFNCALCENIQQIDVYAEISQDLLTKRYLDVELPVIIKKTWPKTDIFFDQILQNGELSSSKPCSLSTNIHNGPITVKNLLRKTRIFDSFFLHFQNCDFSAMKQFRGIAPRLSFIPPELSPVQYNWLLWSKDYNVSHYKKISLVEKVAVVGQISGANYLKLVPRNNCEGECAEIEVRLQEGESIVFSSLWNLEYRPDVGENIAAILELH